MIYCIIKENWLATNFVTTSNCVFSVNRTMLGDHRQKVAWKYFQRKVWPFLLWSGDSKGIWHILPGVGMSFWLDRTRKGAGGLFEERIKPVWQVLLSPQHNVLHHLPCLISALWHTQKILLTEFWLCPTWLKL